MKQGSRRSSGFRKAKPRRFCPELRIASMPVFLACMRSPFLFRIIHHPSCCALLRASIGCLSVDLSSTMTMTEGFFVCLLILCRHSLRNGPLLKQVTTMAIPFSQLFCELRRGDISESDLFAHGRFNGRRKEPFAP